jgi:hypothetical protein
MVDGNNWIREYGIGTIMPTFYPKLTSLNDTVNDLVNIILSPLGANCVAYYHKETVGGFSGPCTNDNELVSIRNQLDAICRGSGYKITAGDAYKCKNGEYFFIGECR